MLNLLNPALTPLKAKLLLFAAGAVLVLLLAAVGASSYLLRAWQAAKVELGQVGQKLADAQQLVIDNQVVWERKAADYDRQLRDKDTLRTNLERAAQESAERERRYNRQLASALKKLQEATDANAEAREWATVPVPAAVIGGMCSAAREAVGEAADCGGDEDGDRPDSGLLPEAVPDPATT